MVSVKRKDNVTIPQVRYCKIWTPPAGGRIDYAEPLAELKRLLATYNVMCIAYDPYDMTYLASLLQGQTHLFRFVQSSRAIADKRLYDMIRERAIEHSGEPDLTQHILNADRKPEDDKLRIVKRASNLKIDAAVALSMAVDRATYYQI